MQTVHILRRLPADFGRALPAWSVKEENQGSTAVAAGGVPSLQSSTDIIGSSRAVLGAAGQCWEAAGQCWKQCSDDGLNSAKWEWPLLVVDWGDKSSHRLRVLRATICETMENQVVSIIRFTLHSGIFSLSLSGNLKVSNFWLQMKKSAQCGKTGPMLMGKNNF